MQKGGKKVEEAGKRIHDELQIHRLSVRPVAIVSSDSLSMKTRDSLTERMTESICSHFVSTRQETRDKRKDIKDDAGAPFGPTMRIYIYIDIYLYTV